MHIVNAKSVTSISQVAFQGELKTFVHDSVTIATDAYPAIGVRFHPAKRVHAACVVRNAYGCT